MLQDIHVEEKVDFPSAIVEGSTASCVELELIFINKDEYINLLHNFKFNARKIPQRGIKSWSYLAKWT